MPSAAHRAREWLLSERAVLLGRQSPRSVATRASAQPPHSSGPGDRQPPLHLSHRARRRGSTPDRIRQALGPMRRPVPNRSGLLGRAVRLPPRTARPRRRLFPHRRSPAAALLVKELRPTPPSQKRRQLGVDGGVIGIAQRDLTLL